MARLPTPLRPYWPQVKATSLRVTRGIAPLSARISRGFGQRALPQDSVTAPEYASETASLGRLHVVRAAESIHRSAPKGYPPGHWAFRPYIDFRVDALSVVELQGGHALRDYGAVLTPDRRLLFDLSPYFGVTVPREHPLYWRPLLPPSQSVSAPVAVLADSRGHELLPLHVRHLAAPEAPQGHWGIKLPHPLLRLGAATMATRVARSLGDSVGPSHRPGSRTARRWRSLGELGP